MWLLFCLFYSDFGGILLRECFQRFVNDRGTPLNIPQRKNFVRQRIRTHSMKFDLNFTFFKYIHIFSYGLHLFGSFDVCK